MSDPGDTIRKPDWMSFYERAQRFGAFCAPLDRLKPLAPDPQARSGSFRG